MLSDPAALVEVASYLSRRAHRSSSGVDFEDRLDLDNVLVVLLGKLGDVVVIRSPNSMARDYEVAMMVAMNFILADCAAS